MKSLDIYLISWVISNIVGILMFWAAYKKPKLAKGMFFLLFGWASWFNYTTAHTTPEVYLDYASMSVDLCSESILGWFSGHITLVVSAIAVGQAFIALGMLLRDRWVKLACIGAILFLMSIAPLGVGAGFPFSITVSIAAYLIIHKGEHEYIWVSRRRKTESQTSL